MNWMMEANHQVLKNGETYAGCALTDIKYISVTIWKHESRIECPLETHPLVPQQFMGVYYRYILNT